MKAAPEDAVAVAGGQWADFVDEHRDSVAKTSFIDALTWLVNGASQAEGPPWTATCHNMSPVKTARRPEPLATTSGAPILVWYTAYGSNLHLGRLNCYLAGGRPAGGARTYPGCRDHSPPRATVPVLLPGQLYFALESMTWTGGMGFYDPFDEGEMPARAYLLTVGQFADIAAQEMYREPGTDLDLTDVLRTGRAELGPGRYETLVCPGQLDGYPLLTFTAPWRRAAAALNRPAAAYLRNFASGLIEAHGWTRERVADYLSARPGAAGQWTSAQILAALGDDARPVSRRGRGPCS